MRFSAGSWRSPFTRCASGKIINRGFLNGPVCPIYGFGMLAICALMNVLAPGQEEAVGLPTLFLAGHCLYDLD